MTNTAANTQQGAKDRISIMAPDGTVRVVEMAEQETSIGRGPENTIVLDYPNVSPRHARIQFDGAEYRVVDLSSTNGTFVGNVKLLPGVPEVWAPDKAVRIGDSWLRLERGKAAAQPAAARPAAAAAAAGGTSRVAAFVESPTLAVDPGGAVTVVVTVLNQGPVVDHLHVSVANLPAGWLPGAAPVIRLLPGARQPVSLIIAPPRRPESRAGTYPVTIRVVSQEAPDQFAEAQAMLTVNPFAQFQCELRPPTIRAGKPAQVRIENQGNTPQTYALSWKDRADELAFEPGQAQLNVTAGQVAAAQFRARARKRTLVGAQKSHSFTAEIAAPTGEKQTLTGEAISRPLIPRWLPPLILVPLLAAVALLIFLFMQGRQAPIIDALSVEPLNPVAGQPVTVRWSVQNAETIELRPLIAGLDPADGQYVIGDGLPASVTIIFVAHNQHGASERPLSLTVSSPTPTPTPEPGEPIIEEFSVSPLQIVTGQQVTIRWQVREAESVMVQPIGTQGLSGQLQEKPQQTTRYTLIATNKGKTVQRSAEVIVDVPTPTRTPTVTPTPQTLIPPVVITPIKPPIKLLPTNTPTIVFIIVTPIKKP